METINTGIQQFMHPLVAALQTAPAASPPAAPMASLPGTLHPDMLVALPASVAFGYLLFKLYELYYQDNEPQDGSLARSLIALTPAMTVTFLIIQSSLTLSLGLLGSLSFVRFRTSIKRPEDVSFVIIAITVAIACAVGQFAASGMLLGMLAAWSWLRNRRGATKEKRFAVITYNTRENLPPSSIARELDDLGVGPEFVSSRAYDGITSYVFNAKRVTESTHPEIQQRLARLDGQAHINVFFPNERLGA